MCYHSNQEDAATKPTPDLDLAQSQAALASNSASQGTCHKKQLHHILLLLVYALPARRQCWAELNDDTASDAHPYGLDSQGLTQFKLTA